MKLNVTYFDLWYQQVFLTLEIEKLRTSLKYDGKQVRKV